MLKFYQKSFLQSIKLRHFSSKNVSISKGEGCGFCKHTGWVEILGCGMVDPNVLEQCGIDSSVYSGYAFGMGVERITNLKYQVSDLRMFSENDVSFLHEFESAD